MIKRVITNPVTMRKQRPVYRRVFSDVVSNAEECSPDFCRRQCIYYKLRGSWYGAIVESQKQFLRRVRYTPGERGIKPWKKKRRTVNHVVTKALAPYPTRQDNIVMSS